MRRKKKSTRDLAAMLESWVSLNDTLSALTEAELAALFVLERGGKNRASFVRRIHARLSRVRTNRERQELAP